MSKILLTLAAWVARILPMQVKQTIYKVGPLARFIRHGLNQAAPTGLTEVNVAAGGLAGMCLELDLQAEKDYWLGTYEPELQAAVAELVQPGMVVYDIGANIGYLSLLFARAAGPSGKVYSFEALPANLERLKTNLARNELLSRVTVVSGAVTNEPGTVRFLVGPSGGMGKVEGSAGRHEVPYSQSIAVPGVVLDSFVYEDGNPAPQVVKMDIEGGEILALPGMRRLLAESRPVMLIELHGPEAGIVVWQELTSAGYRICRMAPGFPGVRSMDELNTWKAYLVALT